MRRHSTALHRYVHLSLHIVDQLKQHAMVKLNVLADCLAVWNNSAKMCVCSGTCRHAPLVLHQKPSKPPELHLA